MSQKLVVAVVCDAIYPFSHGGREVRYKELLSRLAPSLEIHVYTMHWWDGPPDYTEAGVTYHAICKLLPMYDNGRRSVRQGFLFGAACLRLLRYRFDVLDVDHIPYFQVFALRLVATLKRKPLIVTWHEVWSRSYWRDYIGRLGWVAWLIESLAMRLPDQIIAASPGTAESLRGTVGKKTSIIAIPNGTDIQAITRAKPHAATTDLVTVGRLISHKRVDVLLDVIAALLASGTPASCRIIGDGPEREALIQRAQALGIDQSIEFCYDVRAQEEVYSLIKAAKLFVTLSDREGFGMAVLEAIACGVPVLTTSAPGNLSSRLVSEYSKGVVCGPGLDDITNAVRQVLVEVRQNAGAESPSDSWVADYDWGRLAERVMDAYIT